MSDAFTPPERAKFDDYRVGQKVCRSLIVSLVQEKQMRHSEVREVLAERFGAKPKIGSLGLRECEDLANFLREIGWKRTIEMRAKRKNVKALTPQNV